MKLLRVRDHRYHRDLTNTWDKSQELASWEITISCTGKSRISMAIFNSYCIYVALPEGFKLDMSGSVCLEFPFL